MKTQFSTQTLVSFHMWLENYICDKGQAYYNVTTPLVYRPDPQLGAGYVTYAAPFKSFVCDSGVQGANIINSVSGSFGTISRGMSGMMVDYENGRVIFPASVGTGLSITGSYAFKELNFYTSNDTQEKIVFTNKYYLNSRFDRSMTGIPPPHDFVTPCIFITTSEDKNKQWALGGLYNTKHTINVNILAETPAQLDGVISLAADSVDKHFTQMQTANWPLNFYGDVKSGYNYTEQANQYGGSNNPGNLYYISDVHTAKVSDYADINQSLFLGLIDFTVEKIRTIH